MLATTLSKRATRLYESITNNIDDVEWWNELYLLDHELVESADASLGEEAAAHMVESFRKLFDGYAEIIAVHITEGYFTTALSWFDLLADIMETTDKKMAVIGQAMGDEYQDRLVHFLSLGGVPSERHDTETERPSGKSLDTFPDTETTEEHETTDTPPSATITEEEEQDV